MMFKAVFTLAKSTQKCQQLHAVITPSPSCPGHLGWHDIDRIIYLCVSSPKVAKASKAGVFMAQNCQRFHQQTLPLSISLYNTNFHFILWEVLHWSECTESHVSIGKVCVIMPATATQNSTCLGYLGRRDKI
jgi:hypothetical protein